MKERDPLTERIIACAYKVHTELGPGFNEKIYHNALKLAFKQEGLTYDTEKVYEVTFQDKSVGKLKIDLLVEDKIIVEVKALTGIIAKVFELQAISYLKVTGTNIGLLINFGNGSCQIRRLMI